MADSTPKTILLKGDPQGREAIAGATITPGMLLEITSDGTIDPHSSAGGEGSAMIARELDITGGSIDDDYDADDTVLYMECRKGDQVYGWLAAGNDVSPGDLLESDGNGALQAQTAASQETEANYAYTAAGVALFKAVEAVDNDPGSGGAAVRIKVEVL